MTDAEVHAELRRRLAAILEGSCPHCASRLEVHDGWAGCAPCGVEYQAHVGPGASRYTERLIEAYR